MPKETPSATSSPTSAEHDFHSTSLATAYDEDTHDDRFSGDDNGSDSQRVSVPLQKRRRVTRACDECRRKKIKCDGKQPCTHCQVYSYSCSYDQPSNRRRNPAPQYVEALEARMKRAEALLRTVLPDDKIAEAIGDPLPDSGVAPKNQKGSAKSERSEPLKSKGDESDQDAQLEAMIANTGSLDLDDQGFWDFHGHSSGLTFLSRLESNFGNILPPPDLHALKWPKSRPGRFRPDGSPIPPTDFVQKDGATNVVDLPARKLAKKLASNALDHACCLLRFTHQPTFYALFERIYSVLPKDWNSEERRFLPLLYAVLALGCLYAPSEKGELDEGGWENATNHGFKYFLACRQLLDILDCRDINSLQAVMFLTMFLQASAKLPVCYSYIGIAMRSALRMGFHRDIKGKFDPVECETRKRMFWVIRKMDVYLSTILGTPRTVALDEVDQEYPTEIDDEFITRQGLLPMPPGRFSTIAAANAHTELVDILAKVVKYIYPIKTEAATSHLSGESHSAARGSSGSYSVSHSKILEIEKDLVAWREKLPQELKPGDDVHPELERVQQLLRMAFAHVHFMLYRPFLHYSIQEMQPKTHDKRFYACAAACISIARNIIHITSNMKKRGLLAGSHWLSMYTSYFAVIALIFYVTENPGGETSAACWKDAKEGKETLTSVARFSHAADRCQMSLKILFGRLPKDLNDTVRQKSTNKKRHAPCPTTTSSAPSKEPTANIRNEFGQVPRANSLPLAKNQPSQNSEKSLPDLTSHRKELSAVGQAQRRSLHEATPTSFSSPVSPDTQGFGSPFAPQYNLIPQDNNGFNQDASGLPDMGPLMFPSDNPFVYPEMQTAALDANGQIDEAYTSLLGQDPSGLIPKTETQPNDVSTLGYDPSTQIYGPMAPYLLSGQQPTDLNSQLQQQQPQGNIDLGNLGVNPNALYAQQFRTGFTPGVNLDELFNDQDWNAQFSNQNTNQ